MKTQKKKQKKNSGPKVLQEWYSIQNCLLWKWDLRSMENLNVLTALSIKRHTCCAQITTIFVMS